MSNSDVQNNTPSNCNSKVLAPDNKEDRGGCERDLVALREESPDHKQAETGLRRKEREIGLFPATGTGTIREREKE